MAFRHRKGKDVVLTAAPAWTFRDKSAPARDGETALRSLALTCVVNPHTASSLSSIAFVQRGYRVPEAIWRSSTTNRSTGAALGASSPQTWP